MHHIPEPVKKLGGGQKKTMSLFNENATKDCYKSTNVNWYRGGKKLIKPKPHKEKIKKKGSEQNIIKDARAFFEF